MEYSTAVTGNANLTIQSILDSKREELLRTGNPLREYKLRHTFPEKYECTNDLFLCAQKILEGENNYRLLEFCALKNRVLIAPFAQVFRKVFVGLG